MCFLFPKKLACVLMIAAANVAISTEREPVAQTGHTDDINAIAFSFDGAYMVTGGSDAVAMLWDTATGKKLREFRGHKDTIAYVSMTDNGKQFVTASHDGSVMLWDTASGKASHKFTHGGRSWHAEISFDGKYVVTSADDGKAILWDAVSGKRIRTVAVYRGDSPSFAICGNNKYVLTEDGKTANLSELTTGKKVQSFVQPEEIWGRAVSGDGKQVLTSLTRRKQAILWDVATGNVIRRFDFGRRANNSITLTRDGKHILIGSDGAASLWDVATGEKLQTFSEHTHGYMEIASSGDGRFVATVVDANRTPVLWDAKTGKKLRTFGLLDGQ